MNNVSAHVLETGDFRGLLSLCSYALLLRLRLFHSLRAQWITGDYNVE